MQPTNVNVGSLFGNKVQYRIPLFQRHYVWGLEDQWQPLWENIEEKSNQRQSQHQRDKFSHFTGAIVIQQKPTNVDEVKKYEIIDGQQRLTTFQIILCALRDICIANDYDDIAEEVDGYILNKGMLSPEYDNEQYKLVPTEFDRFPLEVIVNSQTEGSLIEKKGLIRPAYHYFETKITSYTDGDRDRILSLFHSILNDFGLVQILIDSDDEPEMIFESLNGRGKSLLQFDLLRNNLFLRTRISEEDRDSLYRNYWSHFETDYWETEVKLGRRKIILTELFFQHFLMAKLGTDRVTPLFKVYQRQYRRNLESSQGSRHELTELHRYSETYKEITDADVNTNIGLSMRFYKLFDITSLHPLILFLTNELKISNDELSSVFHILESYTIRRIICTSQGHKNYNKFFSEVIRKLRGNEFSINTFINLLSEQRANTTKWPADYEVEAALNGQWHNINVNRNAIRYILYRFELFKRGGNKFTEIEELPFKQFTLEHIMPEKWQAEWFLPVGNTLLKFDDLFTESYKEEFSLFWRIMPSKDGLVNESYLEAFELALERKGLLQSIGNLTVINGRLNSSMSNSTFSKKKDSLFSNSTLMLSKEIYSHDSWDIDDIRERERQLFHLFCKIWPDSKWFDENIKN